MNEPLKFKAAWLETTSGKLAFGEAFTCEPLQKGQVLVQVRFSGVCGSQLMEANGRRGQDKWLPHLLGHEAVGMVKQTGPGVSKVQIGQDVVLTWIKASGLDVEGGAVATKDYTINAGPVTTFSGFTIVSENRLVPLPGGIPDDIGVLFGCALPTGLGMILNELNPTSGDSVILFGLGGVGLCALMGLVISGCDPIIAVDPSPEKRALAKALGATIVLDPNKGDIRHALKKLLPFGSDKAVDAAGRVETIEIAFECVRKNGGKCIFASHPPSNEKLKINPHDLISGKSIQGSWGGGSNPDRDIPRFAELYRQGHLPLEEVVGKCYALKDINKALAELESGTALRPILDMSLDCDD